MSYIVIARKYRPQKFDEVVGQEAIATTLKNAISLNRIAHAYLFAGPRGVGKTSMARILAKALNCKNGPTPEPCGDCPSCGEIQQGRSLDVIEIDGASNRGIDDIRSIRESIKFSPASGKFKIYIVDEVHQITQDGFNALLKTLEEPPSHAKFIFATTAPQRIPATVLSRCQRFDFRRIPTATIAGILGGIATKEQIKIHENALQEISKAADGSLRDAQSILDQLSSFTKGEISFPDVTEALGSVNPEEFFVLFEAVASKNAEGVLLFLDRIFEQGKEPTFFLEKCLEHVRNLMVVKVSPDLASLVEGSDTYCDRLRGQAGLFSREDLFYFFAVFVQAMQNLRRFNTKRIPLEMALVKCTLREPMTPFSSVVAEVAATTETAKTPETPLKKNSDDREEPSEPADVALEEIWDHFVKRVRAEKISAASFLQEGSPIAIRGNCVIIGFPPELSFHAEALQRESNITLLEKHLSDLLNRKARVEFRLEERTAPVVKEGAQGDAPTAQPESSEKDTEVLRTALGIFGGRVIKN